MATQTTLTPAPSLDGDVQPVVASKALLDQFSRPSFDSIGADDTTPAKPAADPTPEPAKPTAAPTPAPVADPAAPDPDKAKAAVADPAPPPAIPDLDSFKLSDKARPGTAAQFDGLKAAAKAREAKLQADIDALKAELEQAKKATGSIPEDVQKELAELRAHRDATAVEEDPIFDVKWGAPVKQAEDQVFGTLRGAGVAEETITQIKQVAAANGGLQNIDWDEIFKVYPGVRFAIYNHVGEYSKALDQRKKAAKEAQQNRDKWSETRAEALKQVLDGDLASQEADLKSQLDNAAVLRTDDPALKPVVEKVRQKALGALRTESKASLAAGMALAFYWKAIADSAANKLTTAEKNQPAELAAAKKQVADLSAQVAALEKDLTKYRGANPRPRLGAPNTVPVGKTFVASVKTPLAARLDAHLAGNSQ